MKFRIMGGRDLHIGPTGGLAWDFTNVWEPSPAETLMIGTKLQIWLIPSSPSTGSLLDQKTTWVLTQKHILREQNWCRENGGRISRHDHKLLRHQQKKEAADPKQTHLPQDAKGPTYKAKDIRVVKRMQRTGKGLIKSIIEEEYKENKEDGKLSYLEL